jgi:quercetin dioxygenase-like cupin family protein
MMTAAIREIGEAAEGAVKGDPRYKSVFTGPWLELPDSDGDGMLVGIRGRSGAVAVSSLTGREAGMDFIEMQPGTAFPPHFHDGDHWIFGVSGRGSIKIGSEEIPIAPGMTIFVRGEDTHAVQGPPANDVEPLTFAFFSDLHHALDDPNRMHKPHSHK